MKHGIECFVYEIVLVLDRFFFFSFSFILLHRLFALLFSIIYFIFYLNPTKWPIFGTLAYFLRSQLLIVSVSIYWPWFWQLLVVYLSFQVDVGVCFSFRFLGFLISFFIWICFNLGLGLGMWFFERKILSVNKECS